MRYKTSNPVFTSYLWKDAFTSSHKMSLMGILLKTAYTLFLVGLTTWYVWSLVDRGENVKWYIYGGLLVAMFFSILTSYKKRWSPVTVPIYGLAKGCFLGGISAYAEARYPGMPMLAVKVSLITFFVMLFLYKWRIVKVTQQFKSVIYSAMATIFVIYIISFILRWFGIKLGIIYGTSWFSIGFTLIAASVASFSLLLDFYYIDRQLKRAPKYMEWVATWGILVSLIWMYVEILRLLKKLAIRF
ncbi:MAG: Bax inhibitor-1/YccA family protein [Flavobacteriaceae bacterium]